jgi:hypothetical protein
MNSFYSTLYGKFADLQIDQTFSSRLIYPTNTTLPFLKTGKGISDCIVGIPSIRLTNDTISYGHFAFEDDEFGHSAAVKLAMASTCLLSSKSILYWLYQDYRKEWVASKSDAAKAGYVINTIFDVLARQQIRQIEGQDFYNDVVMIADLLSAALLVHNPKDFSELIQTTLASYLLGVPVSVSAPILKTTQNYLSKLNALAFDGLKITNALKDDISDGNSVAKIAEQELGWKGLVALADSLYATIASVSGKWHITYIPYSHASTNGSTALFQGRLITEQEFSKIRRQISKGDQDGDDSMWQEICFELFREEKRREKTLSKLSRATRNLNFASTGFPTCDYISYYKLYTELAPQIRRIIERVRMVKNVLDENMMEESGNIDLQIAIQAVASESPRNDIFTKDENLLKSESWTVLIDSSLSLGGSSEQVKAVSICLAEAAREVMGPSPWGMFAFSDELYCIKDFTEPYDSQAKSRIGGLIQNGLSYIPDALRACRNLVLEHAKDRNYLILVSDGLPSGYPGIEGEFDVAIKELGRSGIDLAAIGVAGSSINKRIRKAKIISEPSDIVKEFMEIYHGLSS